jgi:hypothetical protein
MTAAEYDTVEHIKRLEKHAVRLHGAVAFGTVIGGGQAAQAQAPAQGALEKPHRTNSTLITPQNQTLTTPVHSFNVSLSNHSSPKPNPNHYCSKVAGTFVLVSAFDRYSEGGPALEHCEYYERHGEWPHAWKTMKGHPLLLGGPGC